MSERAGGQAAHPASNVVALQILRKKNSAHCAWKQSPSSSGVVALERQGPSLNRIWTLTQPLNPARLAFSSAGGGQDLELELGFITLVWLQACV